MSDRPDSAPPDAVLRRRLPYIIMAALAIWGLIHALGAYLYNYNPWRGIIVLACMAVFIGWWVWLLRLQARRMAERENSRG